MGDSHSSSTASLSSHYHIPIGGVVQAGQEEKRGMRTRLVVPPQVGVGVEMAAKEKKKDGSRQGFSWRSGKGGIQEEGCDLRSHRGKASQEDKTEKQAPALGVRAFGTFRKAGWLKHCGRV